MPSNPPSDPIRRSPPLRARVHGGGPSGALAALALAHAGWRVTIHDPLSPARLRQRSRAYAFNHSSQRLLRDLDLWDSLAPAMVPFHDLHLADLGWPSGWRQALQVHAGPDGPVGWIAQHEPLMALLLERLLDHPAISSHLGEPLSLPAVGGGQLATGAERPAERPVDLVVAADGPHSPTRTALALPVLHHPYRQACLTVQVRLRGAADDGAWELLRPEGPLAILPLGHGRFQVVWSAPEARCRQLESLEAAAFLDALAAVLPERFQPEALIDQPRAFPVALQQSLGLHRGSTVLVGESAHRCHPVGGQGLNLCWRDVQTLHRLAARAACGRLAPQRLAAAYACRRWPDLLVTLLATHLLVSLFSNRQPVLVAIRRRGLALLRRLPPLGGLVLRLMTRGEGRLRLLAPW